MVKLDESQSLLIIDERTPIMYSLASFEGFHSKAAPKWINSLLVNYKPNHNRTLVF